MPSSRFLEKGPGPTSLQHYHNSQCLTPERCLAQPGKMGPPESSYRERRLPAARSFGLKTSFLSVINKRWRDKAEHNPCGTVDRPRSAKGAVIF
jgi:hypothetical protein